MVGSKYLLLITRNTNAIVKLILVVKAQFGSKRFQKFDVYLFVYCGG